MVTHSCVCGWTEIPPQAGGLFIASWRRESRRDGMRGRETVKDGEPSPQFFFGGTFGPF